MRAIHRMPFGAIPNPAGGVRFRLWAPGARALVLVCDDGERAMPAIGGGWYEIDVAEAGPGTRYRYRLEDGLVVPDPASRFQPEDVHGPSEVVDPLSFDWPDDGWTGRPWEETVLYELHLGAFTSGGSYDDAIAHLDDLAALGVTAIELMPLADSPGARNWGYDGAFPFAPDARHGRPEALKRLIAAAHARGLMVFLDVVYNHFGPEGNYLPRLAPGFFTERYHTPWGAAIDYDGMGSRPVRDFFIENALYWLEEYRIDGLRFDAVHAIFDRSSRHILDELADTVHRRLSPQRHVHLVLENDDNAARYLARDGAGRARRYAAQWNDDLHHAIHVLVTGEADGYYADYADRPAEHLARTLAEGFAWQGEPSPYRGGAPRGEPSALLPPTAFVAFLQNHDQIGNRAFGDRMVSLAPPEAVEAALAVLLLAPQIPLLFMGEEWGTSRPFAFFCDFGDELAEAVRQGRRNEFAGFPRFKDPAARERIPDPNAQETFATCVLDWSERDAPGHRERLDLTRRLLALRRREIVPLLAAAPGGAAAWQAKGTAIAVRWTLAGGAVLRLHANLGKDAASGFESPAGRMLLAMPDGAAAALAAGGLPAWSVVWHLDGSAAERGP